MNLTEHKVDEFIHVLASDAPAPGGGSASALAGAVGTALVSMVASLTVGKEKYKAHEAEMQEAIKESDVLKNKLLHAIDEDTASFNKVTDVFKMPKNTDEEKEARKSEMQEALKFATKTPYAIMEYAYEALQITQSAIGKSNTNAASDLGVSALNLKAAIQGAWLNVLINLSGIKDEAFKEEYTKKGEAILAKALPMADQVYETILNSLS